MGLYVVGRGGEHVSMRGLLTALHLLAFTLPLAYTKNAAFVDAQAARLRADVWGRWSMLGVRQQRVAAVLTSLVRVHPGVCLPLPRRALTLPRRVLTLPWCIPTQVVLGSVSAPTLLFLALMAAAALHLLRDRNAAQVEKQVPNPPTLPFPTRPNTRRSGR